MQIITGPCGSGKSERLISITRSALAQHKRVAWVGLPHQRQHVQTRLANAGGGLGIEFLQPQSLYYTIVAQSQELRVLVRGAGQLALLAHCYSQEFGCTPNPGDLELYRFAISEAKQNGVMSDQIPGTDIYAEHLRRVYHVYEKRKQTLDLVDYEDFRLHALKLLEQGRAHLPWNMLIVDGFRTLTTCDLQLFEMLGRMLEVYVSLPEAPSRAETIICSRPPTHTHQTFAAPNPVEEARWVMRSLKHDLTNGYALNDLAIIAPREYHPAFLALEGEFRVPLRRTLEGHLTDIPSVHYLVEFLSFPNDYLPERLAAIRTVESFRREATTLKLKGREALQAYAQTHLGEAADTVLETIPRLLRPGPEAAAYGNEVLTYFLQAQANDIAITHVTTELEPHRQRILTMLEEAYAITSDPDERRRWWIHLLTSQKLALPKRGGVPLHNEVTISGIRYRKVYLTHAFEGAYSAGEQECFFIPEELRVPNGTGLPRRYAGKDALLKAELLTRADDALVVTYARATAGGRQEPDLTLTLMEADDLTPLPILSAGSTTEATPTQIHIPTLDPVPLVTEPIIAMRDVAHYAGCGFKYWANKRFGSYDPANAQPPRWTQLRSALTRNTSLTVERAHEIAQAFPEARAWLDDPRTLERLLGIYYGFERTYDDRSARVDGIQRAEPEVVLYRFAPTRGRPITKSDEYGIRERIVQQVEEIFLAYHLIKNNGAFKRARFVYWPLLEKPYEFVWGFDVLQDHLDAFEPHVQAFAAGQITITPDFNHCDGCRHGALCGEADA